MPDLRSLAGIDLPWVRTGYLPAAFALRWDDTEVGQLYWERLFFSSAIARTAAGAWRIRRVGLRRLVLEEAETGQLVGTVQLRLLGSGELTLPERTVTVRRAGMLPPAIGFDDADGSPLVLVQGHFATLLRGGTCRFEPAAASLPEAGLVALLGMYILIRRARRRAHN